MQNIYTLKITTRVLLKMPLNVPVNYNNGDSWTIPVHFCTVIWCYMLKKDGCHSSHSRADWHKVASLLIIFSPLSFFHSAIVKDLEVEWCEMNTYKRCNVGDSICGYGDQYETIIKKLRQQTRKLDEDVELWLSEKLGEGLQPAQQISIAFHFGQDKA